MALHISRRLSKHPKMRGFGNTSITQESIKYSCEAVSMRKTKIEYPKTAPATQNNIPRGTGGLQKTGRITRLKYWKYCQGKWT